MANSENSNQNQRPNELIDRAAKAIDARLNPHQGLEGSWQAYRPYARAVIEEIMEPTGEMLLAGEAELNWGGDIESIYCTMIYQALR